MHHRPSAIGGEVSPHWWGKFLFFKIDCTVDFISTVPLIYIDCTVGLLSTVPLFYIDCTVDLLSTVPLIKISAVQLM